ncbi:MAG: VTT domain-containing protein [Anaerolineales bacterium]|jgi:uncharacterized membrane protein YdjX (TVP38/TMEM64 family)
MDRGKWRAWLIVAISFGLAIIVVIFIARHQTQVEDVIRRLGAFGPIMSVLLYIVLGVSPIPADSLTLINGAVFGPFWGAGIAWLGTTLAALAEYYLGMRIADASDFEQRKQELPWGLDELPVESVWFLVGARMITGALSKIVSYMSGLYHVPIGRYLWTSALSMLFGAVVYALGGVGLLSIF